MKKIDLCLEKFLSALESDKLVQMVAPLSVHLRHRPLPLPSLWPHLGAKNDTYFIGANRQSQNGDKR